MGPIRLVASSAVLLSSLAVFSPLATAQHGGMGAPMGHPVGSGVVATRPAPVATAAQHAAVPLHAGAPVHAMPARTSVGRVAMPGGSVYRPGVNGTPVQRQGINFMSGLANLPLFPTSFNDSPGLGFDFSHLAAIHSGRFGSRFHRGFDNGFGFSGFLLTSPEVIVEGPAGEGPLPPEENVAANGAGPDARSNLEDQFLPSTTPSAPEAPPRDEPEYVFVRRDGTLLFGVAFSWDHGTLRYVTRDGLRRSVSQDVLDMDATQQFNEQRGVSFRLPA